MNEQEFGLAMKSRHLKPNEGMDAMTRCQMQKLRAGGRVYEADPYVEVTQIRESVYRLFANNADDVGDVWMYLIVGSQKAMLIDTGFGIGNLKELCDVLTGGKPLIVVNTHPHPDHAYGNCRFERGYCHEYSVPELKQQNARMWDYLFDEDGREIWLEFDRADLPAFHPYEICACRDGERFDLGDSHEIELIHTAGHHAGHACFLDRKNRILFAGDALSSVCIHAEGPWEGQLYPEYATLWAYRRGIQKLASRLDEFDEVNPSHDLCGLKSDVILNILAACDGILRDSAQNRMHGEAHFRQAVKGLGTIAYRSCSLEDLD